MIVSRKGLSRPKPLSIGHYPLLNLAIILSGCIGITGVANASEEENLELLEPASFSLEETNVESLEIDSRLEVTEKEVTETTEISQEEETLGETVIEQPLAPDEVRILAPEAGQKNSRSTNLIVQYNASSEVRVEINQKPLNPNLPTQIEQDEEQNLITQVWYNVPLQEGENVITVVANNGTPVTTKLTVEEAVIGQIQLFPAGDPRVPADGRSTITLEGSITDAAGELITEETFVTLTSSAGKFIGTDQDEDRPGFQVLAREGTFKAELQSNLEAQKVKIRAAVESFDLDNSLLEEDAITAARLNPQDRVTADLETYSQVEFITYLRPSLVSGVLNLRIGEAGTDFFGSRREFLNPTTMDDDFEADVDAAVFATGAIGEWLFTGAYNSERPLNETCDGITRLFRGPQECEKQYSVYGDSSSVEYLTPSTTSVYLRFERQSPVTGAEPDYFMWGDYYTTEFSRPSQLFTATTRALNGFKGNLSLGNLQLTALYSPDVDGFQRDTLVPDGTSGYYFLARRQLVPGSENIFIETEEINRPGTVISREALSRGPDYEIDYDRGTLLFRRPMQQLEFDPFGNTLVRKIVATYQFEGDTDGETDIYAGRVQYNFSQDLNQENWLAATYLYEDQGSQDFELYGADFLFNVGEKGRFIGEFARSHNNSPLTGNVAANAYRLELQGEVVKGVNARAFYRSVETGFANNATTSFTPGQTRYGAAILAQVAPTTTLQASFDREENFGVAPAVRTVPFDLFNPNTSLFNPGSEALPGTAINNDLTAISAGVRQKLGDAELNVDYVHRSRNDDAGNIFDSDSDQVVSYLNVPVTETIALRAKNEINLGDGEDPLYPNRTTFGIDWKVQPEVTMRLAHQFYDGGLLGDNSITSLETITEKRLGEDTYLYNRYALVGGYNGVTGQGSIGLGHRLTVAPGFRINLGYELVTSDISSVTAAGPRFAQPYAVGQSSSSLGVFGGEAYSVGFEYTANPDFQVSGRFEQRNGSGRENTVWNAAAAGKVTPGLTALFRFDQANTSNQILSGLGDTVKVKMGLAYRDPHDDRFNALLKYEYRRNPSIIPETLLFGSGTGSTDHVVSTDMIYAPDWRWEFYGKFAMRSSTTNLASNFSNSSSVFLSQLRATYRTGYNTDVALEGRWIGQPSTNFDEFGFAAEAGYYLTPDLRIGLGYSFGSVDDGDFDGYRSDGGPYLNLTLKVNELFGGFGRQRPVPAQQQESEVSNK